MMPGMASDADTAGTPVTRGTRMDAGDAETFRAAIRAAVDYRGDVSLHIDGRPQPLVGFVFDLTCRDDDGQAAVRLLPADGQQRLTIPVATIRAIEFTGKDAAAGKSFETWVKKYLAKKAAGEPANIEADPLDDA